MSLCCASLTFLTFCIFSTNYKDALKYGFYEMQSTRDWYREVTSDVGMHADLVEYWIRISALLILPIAPHFSEHIWSTVLKEPVTVQKALCCISLAKEERRKERSAGYCLISKLSHIVGVCRSSNYQRYIRTVCCAS